MGKGLLFATDEGALLAMLPDRTMFRPVDGDWRPMAGKPKVGDLIGRTSDWDVVMDKARSTELLKEAAAAASLL